MPKRITVDDTALRTVLGVLIHDPKVFCAETPTTGAPDAERPARHGRHNPDLSPAVLDRHGAAGYLGVGLSTLAELTASASVPSFTVGRRRLYRVLDLEAWIAARVTGGDAA